MNQHRSLVKQFIVQKYPKLVIFLIDQNRLLSKIVLKLFVALKNL